MSVLILGSEGSQGKRYQAILRHLGVAYLCKDLDFQEVSKSQMKRLVKSVIIATPTETHEEQIDWCLSMGIGKKILVEKPVSKDLKALKRMLRHFSGAEISMVHQYRQLVGKGLKGHSLYNYFKHGNDGLGWDCLQIIALAEGNITLLEDSPIWTCVINGLPLKIQSMDRAYVLETAQWLKGYGFNDAKSIYDIHKRVSEFEL